MSSVHDIVGAVGKFGTLCCASDVITGAGGFRFIHPLFAMAAARVRMPANLGEAFSMKLADFVDAGSWTVKTRARPGDS
jgi:hypothetical protein